MKITAGLGSIDEYVRYVRAGADEFFCGYVPYEWNKKYGTVLPLNRREVLGINVQIGAESELRILAALVRKYGKPVHLTFNSLYYTRSSTRRSRMSFTGVRSLDFQALLSRIRRC